MAAGGAPTDRERQVDAQVLRYTVRRGERVGVSKEDYLRELSKTLQGIRYSELEASLERLKGRGLVTLDLLGLKDFVVRPTQQAVESFGSSRVTERAWDEASKGPIPCPKCGETMPPGSKVCGTCGFSFASIVTAAGAAGSLGVSPAKGLDAAQPTMPGPGRRPEMLPDDVAREWERLRTKERMMEEKEAEFKRRMSEEGKKFEEKKTLLDGMMRELEIAEVEMEKREAGLRDREKKAGEWVKSAQSQVATAAVPPELKGAEETLKKREDEVGRKLSEVGRREESIDAREGSLIQRMNALQEMEGALKERERLLDEREAKLRAWADELTRMHKDVTAAKHAGRADHPAAQGSPQVAVANPAPKDEREKKDQKPIVGPPPSFKK
jgi:hypothetical protein